MAKTTAETVARAPVKENAKNSRLVPLIRKMLLSSKASPSFSPSQVEGGVVACPSQRSELKTLNASPTEKRKEAEKTPAALQIRANHC